MRAEPPIPKELWDTIPPAAQAALLVAFEHLEQRVELLEHEIADLKSRLNQNSTNSSRPPSSDPPSVKRAPPQPPSGNGPERTLRHGVLWRKSSGGTDSPAGSRFVERVLSVVATCRQQNRNVLEFLTACCRARLDGSGARSLLPGKAMSAAAA